MNMMTDINAFNSTSLKILMTTLMPLDDNASSSSMVDDNMTYGTGGGYGGGGSWRSAMTPVEIFFRYSPIMSVSMAGVILNIIAIVLLVKTTSGSKTSTHLFLISQLVFDLASAISAVFLALGEAFRPTDFSDSLPLYLACKLWYSRFLILSCTNMSIFNCCLLTLERYIKIVFPLKHRIDMTRKVSMIALGVTFTFNIFNSSFMYLYKVKTVLQSGECDTSPTVSDTYLNITRIYNNIVLTGIPFTIIIFCYGHMLVSLRKRSKRFGKPSEAKARGGPGITLDTTSVSTDAPNTEFVSVYPVSSTDISIGTSDQMTTSSAGEGSTSNTKKRKNPKKSKPLKNENVLLKAEKNLLKVALFVSLSFIMCNAPVRLYYMLSTFGLYETSHGGVYMVFATLIYLNFALHPVIYALTLKSLRDKLVKICRRR